MNILINCSNLKIGGGLQVAHSFINQLKHKKDHRFYVVVSSILMKQLNLSEFEKCDHIHFIEYSVKPSILKAVTGRDTRLSAIEMEKKIDRVFTVFGPSYWRPRSKHICGFAKSQYIYVDSPFFEKMTLKEAVKLNIKKLFHIRSFNRSADAYITELWDVSHNLKSLLPGKEIHTVTNTYNQIFDKEPIESNKHLPTFDGVTLLTISAQYPHKNLEIIPDVIKSLKKKYPNFKFRFVLTLLSDAMIINDPMIGESIEFIGKVDIEECPTLYKAADFMFLPTLLECFSASYPEAMKMNTPILTSDLPFARSICGEAAEYFDPMDPEDIADKIYSLASNPERQKELRTKGKEQLRKFDTAESRARKYIEIITR